MMIYKIIQLRFVNGLEDVALVAAKFDNAAKSGVVLVVLNWMSAKLGSKSQKWPLSLTNRHSKGVARGTTWS